MAGFTEKYGHWALITGASSGIGREFALQLAALGLNVVIAARRVERLSELSIEISNKYNVEVRPLKVDLSKDNFMELLIDLTNDLDIGLLVNNAGFGSGGEFVESDIEKQMELLNVNYKGISYMVM